MKKLLLLLVLSAAPAFAQTHVTTADADYSQWVDPSLMAIDYSFNPVPAGGANGLKFWDGTNQIYITPALGVNFIYAFTGSLPGTLTATLDIAQPDWNQSSSSGAGYIKNKPTLSTRSTSTGVSHSLNASFQISSTRDSQVSYSVEISAAISLVTGQTGTILLQMSPNGSTGWVTLGDFIEGNTGTLTLGLALTNTQAGQLVGYIPAGYYVQLVSSGTATSSYLTGQETLL